MRYDLRFLVTVKFWRRCVFLAGCLVIAIYFSSTPHAMALLLVAATVVVSRYGGILSALACAMLSAIILDWFYIIPHQMEFTLGGVIPAIGFISVALVLAFLESGRRDALRHIEKLHGLLPICSYCKKIHDENGRWEELESYIRHHSGAKFTHGICPQCYKAQFPDLYEKFYGRTVGTLAKIQHRLFPKHS
jgi:hypothetical protein